MSIRPLTYRILSWLEAPRIEPDLLWSLVLLFAGLGAAYTVLTFWMRNRISARREAIRLRKRELAPMISNFLFYRHDAVDEDREGYIRMKIEIRELLKQPMNREVMTDVLMDLSTDVSGDARDRLFQLFQDLNLHLESFRKLESWRWERISQGILELTDMKVEKAYPFIRKFINDRRGIIRKQAQLATVMLRNEGISYFLDTARYRISEWQQLKLLEILRQREDFNPPRFKAWLTSENRDVVFFALRLIRYYHQNDAESALVTLLRHRSTAVKVAALECIREFRCQSALEPVKMLFPGSKEELKLLILDTLGLIGSEQDLGFLEHMASKDRDFIIRSKARATMNLLKPGSALPLVGTESKGGGNVPEPIDAEADPFYPDLELSTGLEDEANTPEAGRHAGGTPAADTPVPGPGHEEEYREFAPEPGGLEWEEDEDLFDLCFLEELDEILSGLNEPDEAEEILPLDFLPIVSEASSEKEKAGLAGELAGFEVVAEWIEPKAGGASPETGGKRAGYPPVDGFEPDFLPWEDTGMEAPEAMDAVYRSEPGPGSVGATSPDATWGMWEPAFDLEEFSQPAEHAADEPYFKANAAYQDEIPGCFSIFRELYRQYDTASKLMLLEQLREVGDEKEWHVLHEWLEDPDPLICAKVREALEFMGKRLRMEVGPGQGVIPAPGSGHPGVRDVRPNRHRWSFNRKKKRHG